MFLFYLCCIKKINNVSNPNFFTFPHPVAGFNKLDVHGLPFAQRLLFKWKIYRNR